jgi:hypothetical protein
MALAQVATPTVAATPNGTASTSLRSSPRPSTSPRTPAPAFLLERGRYTGFDAPGAVQRRAGCPALSAMEF